MHVRESLQNLKKHKTCKIQKELPKKTYKIMNGKSPWKINLVGSTKGILRVFRNTELTMLNIYGKFRYAI